MTFILHQNLDITVQIIAYTADGLLSLMNLATNIIDSIFWLLLIRLKENICSILQKYYLI